MFVFQALQSCGRDVVLRFRPRRIAHGFSQGSLRSHSLRGYSDSWSTRRREGPSLDHRKEEVPGAQRRGSIRTRVPPSSIDRDCFEPLALRHVADAIAVELHERHIAGVDRLPAGGTGRPRRCASPGTRPGPGISFRCSSTARDLNF
jgi:hypothetical protein